VKIKLTTDIVAKVIRLPLLNLASLTAIFLTTEVFAGAIKQYCNW